ncbi:hypothetical protein [uncultured Duncaniella sp.]|uniref:hypothetical protein n=1 Tax=uncultured Duncaniella sp. TaxID=2768039 RepID=UPI002611D5A8|nr:hypothetical protein [uncultured Duncaniella sp.]
MKDFLFTDGKYIYINAPYAEAYVPEDIIENPNGAPKDSWIAYEYGDGFIIFGICYMRFFENESQARDSVPVHTLMYPNLIETHPTESTKAKLEINGLMDNWRVLKFYHGDILMEANSRKSATNCEAFMKLLTSGKLPRSLSYDEVFTAWMDNYEINGMTPEVPYVVHQAIIAEMYRNPADPSQQFAKVIAANPKIDPRSYIAMNMNAVSAYSSVMSALSFERMSEKLTSSINMTKSGVEQKKSPIEAVITM